VSRFAAAETISIVAERAPTAVFVILGSNIEPQANLVRALEHLQRELEIEAVSGVWESEPYGAPGTPRFLNAAVRIVSVLPPAALKRLLRRIETDLGRRREGDRNAPRTIDLDLVLFGSLVVDDPATGLRIPDPEISSRAYLALPLAEVGPEVCHPESGELLADIAARLAEAPAPPRRISLELGSGPVAGF
jgi:2-amino-4-hydroxy-6-hydroxymethyldihydropteridine diphosphokinase